MEVGCGIVIIGCGIIIIVQEERRPTMDPLDEEEATYYKHHDSQTVFQILSNLFL